MQSDPLKFAGEGLTYDDVLLIPAYSETLPREVNTQTRLTRNIRINIPIVSAAMDTVTESALAIAIAQEGGIGILHKNMSIERQALEVRKVKRSESGMILDPVTLRDDATLEEALALMKEYKIGGIPIVDGERKLTGILTNRDLRFQKDITMKVGQVMTRHNLVIAPEGTDLAKAEEILQNHKIEKLPVVDKDGRLSGLITYKDIQKFKNFPTACKDTHGRLRVGAAVGVTADTLDRVAALVNAGVDVIIIDTAHGHSRGVIIEVKKVKERFPDLEIIAGNVGTGEGAKALADAGVDGVKVGIGPGSICTTRVVAGVGVPQLSAVYEAAKALQGMGIPVIADGGIKQTGDIVKAIAAGASSVMAGSLFAGVEESPGETIIYEGRKFKSYRGMGSVEAMELGSKDRYFQDVEDDIKKLVPEGIVGRVPYKGTLREVMHQYIGGLRAGMGYCGAATIEDLQKARFVKITAAGLRESHPHDIIITKEAPNYSR
ncbi:IMP dehydrogenase [Anseongella ginsenosidimutans]|uniref:Inosine-5'-monophosphate dehydrogenase n=1 Tax=Anseongella ginsenosidimutans TaxID=496056 RepID=A0A4R3KSJ8_9SPHI|nr:IMP dehydrogenase [Anseongella ginsenosidimutans]QEC53303.1 IMP dehydrogenase [Anseongella ginsenosidimutans]TCS88178.1 IMP dehydrogenase [Anseongella ginsenosidimutans]